METLGLSGVFESDDCSPQDFTSLRPPVTIAGV